jgi:dipeptidyl aminopeptidase/acylaminoacyl peptidase
MKDFITYENLRKFAYSNDELIRGKVKGIVLQFNGLGNKNFYKNHLPEGQEYADENVIFVIPYYNPWCWMNEEAVSYVDEIVEVLCRKYELGDDAKIVSTGGSMGGLSALTYCAYAKRTPVSCVANCPVCDLPYHFTERDDLPRTLYSAFAHFDGSIDEALESRSPLHLAKAGRMPEIPYRVFHCIDDAAVNIYAHSERFIKALGEGYDVQLVKIPHRSHTDLSPKAAYLYREAILNSLK